MQIEKMRNKKIHLASLLVGLSFSALSFAEQQILPLVTGVGQPLAETTNSMTKKVEEAVEEKKEELVIPPTGQEIAEEAWERDRGFEAFSGKIVMTTITSDGKEIIRKLRTKTKETTEGDKSISVFDAPRDIKGVARLTYASENGNDNQWMYIADRKRVKRISSVNDSTPFMGTDFAFEDLGTQRPEEVGSFIYTYKGEEACGEYECFIVKRFPLNPHSGYSSQLAYINKEYYRMEKIEYFDKAKNPLKILTYSGYKLFKDKFWRPGVMLMKNSQTGSTTKVEWSEYSFGGGSRESEFTPARLKRVR